MPPNQVSLLEESLAGTVVSRAIIVGLGREGLEVAWALRRRLDERVGPNLPMIRYLVLADPEALGQPGLEPADEFMVYLPLDWRPDDLEDVRRLANVEEWLPVLDEGRLGDLSCRAAARLVLVKHYARVQETVRRLLLAIATPTERKAIEAGVEAKHQPSTYFYLIASLANPLAGGLVVDLAYLLGQAIRPVQDDAVPGVQAGMFRFVNAVLLLPGFREGATTDVESRLMVPEERSMAVQEEERAAQTWQQAHAYATLLELDHYMGMDHPYRCEFRRLDGPVQVSAGYRPVWNGHCFLLGPAIERATREYRVGWLADVGVAVAESLYHRLAAPAAGFLEPYQAEQSYQERVSAYASFGVSAEVLPWRDLREYCVRRLSAEMVDALLQAGEPVEPEEADEFLKRVQITPESLRRHLVDDADWEPHLQRDGRRRPRLDRIGWLDARRTEAALMQDDHQWRRDLAEVDMGLAANGEALLERAATRIHEELRRLLDYQPVGSLQRTITLAQEVREALKQEQRHQSQVLEERQEALPAEQARVARQRGRYFLAVAALSRYYASPILSAVALVFLYLMTDAIIGQEWDRSSLATTTIVASLVAFVGVFAGIGIWARSARASLAEAYRRRQAAERELAEQERLVEVYGVLARTFAGLVGQLTDFRQKLAKVQAQCRDVYKDEGLHYRLFQKPSFVLEESVLTPEIVDEFYGQVTAIGVANMAAELGGDRFGPYSRWIFAGHSEEELLAHLEGYAGRRVEPLRGRGVLELLDRLDNDRLRRRMESLRDLAQPMWDLDALEPEPELQRVTAVEAGGADRRPMRVMSQLCPQNHRLLDRSSPHYLTHTSIRWGAPLFAIQSIRRCRDDYDALVRRGHLAELHTTREHQALADLYPWETEDPRTIFALGRAFELIQDENAGAQFYFLYQTNQDLRLAEAADRPLPDRRAALGRSKEEACRTLTISRDWYAMVEHKVLKTAQENIEQVFEGNRLRLAYALRRYKDETAGLAGWEKEVLQGFIDRLDTDRWNPQLPPEAELIGRVTTEPRFLTLDGQQAARTTKELAGSS